MIFYSSNCKTLFLTSMLYYILLMSVIRQRLSVIRQRLSYTVQTIQRQMALIRFLTHSHFQIWPYKMDKNLLYATWVRTILS